MPDLDDDKKEPEDTQPGTEDLDEDAYEEYEYAEADADEHDLEDPYGDDDPEDAWPTTDGVVAEEPGDTQPASEFDEDQSAGTRWGRTVLAFLAGLLAGALVLGAVWLVQERSADNVNDPDDAGSAAQGLLSGQRREPEPAVQGPSPSRLARCAEVHAAGSAPLQAVSPALAQWEIHIGAMNQLVVGAITLRQATQFWNDTRVGARQNLRTFARAHRAFSQRTARCPQPPERTGASAELRRCSAVVVARNRELRRAAVTLRTWRTHVAHMEMLRRGEMTPAEATAMWLRSWRQGTKQVHAYHDAAAEAKRIQRSIGDGAAARSNPCTD